DGFTLRETVAEYYQVARLTPKEFLKLKIKLPKGWAEELKQYRSASQARKAKALGDGETGSSGIDDDELVTPLYGGGTLLFDDYGGLKYWIHNDVFGDRQSPRLEYLYGAGLLRVGRGGARLSAARLSAVHRLRAIDTRRFPREGW